MTWLGDIRLGDTIDCKFTTTAAATGAPTTLAGTPVISAYVGNSVTQITAGITLTVDFDGVTGLHNVRVVATSGNGYATASNYQLVITTGTVGGTSAVGYVIGQFSIEARSALMPTTAARTLDVSAGGEAGLDWANIGSPTTAQNLSATNIDVDQVVASVSGAVGSVTGAVGSVTGAVGSVTARVTANTDQLAGQTVTAAAGVTFPGSVASPTNITAATGVVLSGVTHTGAVIPTVTTLTGHTPQTGDSFARIGATGSGLTSLASQASVTAVDDFVDTEIADIQARLPAALVGGRMDSSTGAMAAAVVTAAAIADGAIDRATFAAETGLQTFRSNTAQAGAATTITLDAGASAVDNFYNNTLIVLTGGTGVGQSRFISAYVGATRVATVATWTTNPDATTTFALLPFDAVAGASAPTAAQNATAVWDRARASHVTAGTFGEGSASVQGNVTGSVASVTGLTASNLDATISSRASAAALATVQSDTDDIQTRIPAALVSGRMDSSIGAAAANTITASALATDAVSEIVTAALTTQMTESYAADGVAPTLAQSLFQILGREYEFAIAGDTLTVRQLDGITTAMTFTLAPAGGPYTSITRTT